MQCIYIYFLKRKSQIHSWRRKVSSSSEKFPECFVPERYIPICISTQFEQYQPALALRADLSSFTSASKCFPVFCTPCDVQFHFKISARCIYSRSIPGPLKNISLCGDCLSCPFFMNKSPPHTN